MSLNEGKSFRVFVSSTFEDLREERDALDRLVFRPLQAWCRERGAQFQAVDMRWGVRDESGAFHQTMNVCLEELQRCREISPRLNFIALVGDRYGWRPVPATLPAHEYEALTALLDPAERERVSAWYRRDDNALPPQYVLQPRTGPFSEPSRWTSEETRIRGVLAAAAARLFPDETDPRRLPYESSATHQEIHQAILAPPEPGEALVYFRRVRNASSIPAGAARRQLFDCDESGAPDSDSATRLDRLKRALRERLPSQNIRDFDAEWDERGLSGNHLESFCSRVREDLERVISREITAASPALVGQAESLAHERIARLRTERFEGREDLLAQIASQVDAMLAQDESAPLILHGPSGFGKTTLMARLAHDLQDRADVVFRFLGTTPASSDVTALLESLCTQVATLHSDPRPVPTGYRALESDFANRLAGAAGRKPLVIVLDALDQLTYSEQTLALQWLPARLPAGTALIVSVLEPTEGTENATTQCWNSVRSRFRDGSFVPLGPLTSEEARRLLQRWLREESSRTLRPEQEDAVLAGFAECPRPLYLRLAYTQARRWRSYDAASSLPLSRNLPGVLGDVFDWLESPGRHGPLLVRTGLGYLGAARHGLSEDELIALLSQDEEYFPQFLNEAHHKLPERRLPMVIWARLRSDLEPYLTERLADGLPLLSFYHRQVAEAVTERYLDERRARTMHARIGAWFKGADERFGSGSGGDGLFNLRKLSELPHQLIQARSNDALLEVLTSETFTSAKCEAGLARDLAEDLRSGFSLLATGQQRELISHTIEFMTAARETQLRFADLQAWLAYHPSKAFYTELVADAAAHLHKLRGNIEGRSASDEEQRLIRRLARPAIDHGGMLRRAPGRLDAARATLEDVFRLDQQLPGCIEPRDLGTGYYELGYAEYLAGDLDRAAEMLARSAEAARLGGDVVGAQISRCVGARFRFMGAGNAESQLGFEEALNEMSTLLEEHPRDTRTVRWRANVVAHLLELATLRKDQPRADALMWQLRQDPFIAAFDRALLMRYEGYYANFAGDFAAADRWFSSYLQSGPPEEELAKVYLEQGLALRGLGQETEATLVWQKGLALGPHTGNAVWQRRIRALLEKSP